MYYYKSKKEDGDQEVMDAIREAAKHEDGFWKIYNRLRADGRQWNHKRVHRVYKLMHYNKRSKLKKRLPIREKGSLATPDAPGDTWSMDFVSDSLTCGRKFRVLNVIDDFNRQAIAMTPGMSITSQRLIKMLEEAIWLHGKPKRMRSDNGPEFISKDFAQWCEANEIEHVFTQPGKPMQNGFIERFNGSYRRGVLDAYMFRNLSEVKRVTDEWMDDYNNKRPHEGLGNKTPMQVKEEYLASLTTAQAKVAS